VDALREHIREVSEGAVCVDVPEASTPIGFIVAVCGHAKSKVMFFRESIVELRPKYWRRGEKKVTVYAGRCLCGQKFYAVHESTPETQERHAEM
jgi:hypothetical protein